MAIHEQGHYGHYSGNARCCAHTRVDAHNYKATERDDAAHIVALEKDMKYDKEHHGPGDFAGGYHKVQHAKGEAHKEGPAKHCF